MVNVCGPKMSILGYLSSQIFRMMTWLPVADMENFRYETWLPVESRRLFEFAVAKGFED